MTVSELIARLQEIEKTHGERPVVTHHNNGLMELAFVTTTFTEAYNTANPEKPVDMARLVILS